MNEEQILISKIQSGDRNAFRTFVDNYKQDVYWMAYRLTGNHVDADDLSQIVFIKFFKSIESYRQESAVKKWLYKIAVNSFIDKKRKKVDQIMFRFSQNEDEDTYEETIISDKANPEQKTEAVIINKHINEAMEKLSPKEKSAFVLKHLQGHSLKEIAELINTSEGTVKSLLFRGVKKLQTALAFYKPELGLEESNG
ncbi:MAG: RNA polymerase sigma factor [Calditrichaeota bacterium]|nr:MAG: RNA polymerase sigma factor [Calditrichota bacterium]MBL1206912.1 RNA polymerase sigma factor [Calditrichota bacterium]NOG46739.1 RNA polymerase sigma factor [Calditrichota bacterium]